MANTVKSFKELTPELHKSVGGKANMLASMYQAGYPVPEGFVILPTAFKNNKLNNNAWEQILNYANIIRDHNKKTKFAVRSSALSEDSAQASFAGEFETVLNVTTDDQLLEAIYTVLNSIQSERVKVYSAMQGIKLSHQIAVIVQLMIPAEISGVLFTADPIAGSFEQMKGNYVHGLGEQLVSGETNAYDFKFHRPKGKYEGRDELKKYAKKLYQHAIRLEKESKKPQDIEWAIAKGNLYILQSRPITTLTPGNLETYEINESLASDTLWVNTNVGEAIPDVVTPLTWSIVRDLDLESGVVPGYYLWSGNICGRIYSNLSHRLSALTSLYGSAKFAEKILHEVFGRVPAGITLPHHPFPRLELIKAMAPRVKHYLKMYRTISKEMAQYLAHTPDWSKQMTQKINHTETTEALLLLWKNELKPYLIKAWWGLMFSGTKAVITLSLSKKLTKLIGTENANALLSNLRGDSELASLGPIIGISKVTKGELSREEYLIHYGHRGPHEFELSIPDPMENPSWLEE